MNDKFKEDSDFKFLFIQEIDDVLTTVIKGHLFIEYIINDLTKKQIPAPDKYEEDISFNTKLMFFNSLYYQEDYKDIFDLVKKLNKIRNKFAHNLFNNKYLDLVNDLNTKAQNASKKFGISTDDIAPNTRTIRDDTIITIYIIWRLLCEKIAVGVILENEVDKLLSSPCRSRG